MDIMEPNSIVKDQGWCFSSCGYCKSEGQTSATYGLWAHSLSVDDYQELLDQTWRRSGMFLYKPQMDETCCPAYTIRLKVESFVETKEHIRVMRRMQRYLEGTYSGHPSKSERTSSMPKNHIEIVLKTSSTSAPIDTEKGSAVADDIARDLSIMVEKAIEECILDGEFPAGLAVPKIIIQWMQPCLRRQLNIRDNEACYTCNIGFRCAAAIAKQKSVLNGAFASIFESQKGLKDKSKVDTLAVEVAESIALRCQKHSRMSDLKVKPCKGYLNFILLNCSCSSSAKVFCSVGRNFDLENKNAAPRVGDSASSQLEGMSKKLKLDIETRRSAFDPEEFALYQKYQIMIHQENPEDVTEDTYCNFLVKTPLQYVPPSQVDSFCGFGSFHQRYLIDGKLVAVGVLDILPSCLSSNYFFWDPDFEFLSLGKYSALREIAWVQEVNKHCPSMKYYYLGHYIHSCPKMHYKVAFRPSELLCPVRFQWVPFEVARPYLDKQPYVCLSECSSASSTQQCSESKLMQASTSGDTDEECPGPSSHVLSLRTEDIPDISGVLLKLGDWYLRLQDFQAVVRVPQEHMNSLVSNLRIYIRNVGFPLAERMAYALD